MKVVPILALLIISQNITAQLDYNKKLEQRYQRDFIVTPAKQKAAIYYSASKKDIILYNGLVKRTFRVTPNVACTGYQNMITGQQLLRSVKPEARVTINNKEYNIGGLHGQRENAYLLDDWVDSFTAGKEDFILDSYKIDSITPFLNWKQRSYALAVKRATGKTLSFIYRAPEIKDVVITVKYEIYDGLPLIVKWLTIENRSASKITINRVVNEELGLVEEESAVVGSVAQMEKQQGIYVETNYAFNNAMNYEISDQTTHWKTDSTYTSQVNYNLQTPCVLEVYPEKVTAVRLPSGGNFTSVRSFELLMDSYDRVRRGLIKKKMYRTVAPWTNQNPIFMHLVSKNDEEVRNAIDQCAATGYEAVILSFGSHLNMEDSSSANLSRWKTLASYAHSKKILIGGYSLFSSHPVHW